MIGDEEGEQPDSDEERENQRVARVRAANAEVAKGRAADGGDEDMPSAKACRQSFCPHPLLSVWRNARHHCLLDAT